MGPCILVQPRSSARTDPMFLQVWTSKKEANQAQGNRRVVLPLSDLIVANKERSVYDATQVRQHTCMSTILPFPRISYYSNAVIACSFQ